MGLGMSTLYHKISDTWSSESGVEILHGIEAFSPATAKRTGTPEMVKKIVVNFRLNGMFPGRNR